MMPLACRHTLRNLIPVVTLATFLTDGGDIMSAQSAGTTAARNKATVESSLNAWAAGTGSPYDLLADDATWTIRGGPTRCRRSWCPG